MKNIILLLFINFSFQLNAQFITPIEGIYGEDYIIVNYPDWILEGSLDHNCGSKTYDQHGGTDFTIRSFNQMDNGVDVLAVDNGIVTHIHDGEFDRNTISNPSLGFGNFITIRHPGKYYGYYAHLKNNSISVNVGDTIHIGQVIAEVGSSGNSTDPHLHFEVWYDSLYLIDPFAGSCGNVNSLWIDSIPYDTSFQVWDHGILGYIPHIDSLRERIGNKDTLNKNDEEICFWNLQYGLRSGDSTRVEWYTPEGNLWFKYTNYYSQDWWFYYYYSYINTPNMPGEWHYKYYHNEELVLEDNFYFDEIESSTNNLNESFQNYRIINDILYLDIDISYIGNNLNIYDYSGHLIIQEKISSTKFEIDLSNIKPERIYFAVITNQYKSTNFKFYY